MDKAASARRRHQVDYAQVPPEPETPVTPEPTRRITFNGYNTVHYVFVGLLVVASFFLGSLYTKVQFLEKGAAPAAAQPQPQAAGAAQPQATPTVGDVPEIGKSDHVTGSANARLTLVEYSDFECPFCKRFHETMLGVMRQYEGKVKWAYRHYPLDFHANAQKQAEASECAAELGGNDAFWKYANALYERTTSNGTGFALDKLVPLAGEFGLNQTAFKTCLDSGKYEKKVKDDRDGGIKAGVQGTPDTIIWDTKTGKKTMIPGALPIEQIKPMIDEMLK